MKKAKRLISFIMAGLITISNLAISAMAKKEKNPNIAEIKLGQTVEKNGFSTAEFTVPGESVASRGDEFGWLLDVKDIDKKGTINFAFSDDFKPVGDFDGSEYEIEIEYYDYLEAFFVIYYDSYEDSRKRGETIYTDNDRQWKTAAIKLDDAVFNRRLDGKYDFSLSLIMPTGPYVSNYKSSNSVVIKSVKVTKIPKENPVFITAEINDPGNSFRYHAEEKNINLTLNNVSGADFDGEVTYKVISANEHILFEKTENVSMAQGEKKEQVLNIGSVTECGIHRLEAEMKTSDKISERILTKLAVIKADPDGIKNDDVAYAMHLSWSSDEEGIKEGIGVLDMANVHGGRTEVRWSEMIDPTTGELDPTIAKSHIEIEEQVRLGMNPITILWGSPSQPPLIRWEEIPGSTQEQLDAWSEYVKAVGREYKGKIKYYEVWNEPNLAIFNSYNIGGETMAKAVNAAAAAMAEVNPEGVVAGCGVVGLDYSYGPGDGRTYFEDALKGGMWEGIDLISVHNYSWGAPEAYSERYLTEIGTFKEEFKKYKGTYPGIWSTEAGFTMTAEYLQGSHQTQGSFTVRQIIFFKEHGLIDAPFNIYGFEQKWLIKTDREAVFGHVSPGHANMQVNGTCFFPTEAFLTVAGYNYVMAQTEYEKSYHSENKNVRIRKFDSKKFGTKVLTLNTVNESEYVTLNLGVDRVRYFDTFGNETMLYGNNGVFSLAVTGDPVYLVGDFKDVEYVDNAIVEYSGTEFSVAEDDILTFDIKNNTDKAYTVELDVPQNVKVLDENISFENGKANVRINNSLPKDTVFSVTVKIMDGENVVQQSVIKIESGESVSLSLECVMDGSGNVDRWKGILTVKNQSATKPVKGTVKFNSPELMAGMNAVDVGLIPKGRTGVVEFNLPKLVRKGQYSFEYSLTTDDGRSFTVAQPFDFTIAKYAKTKPVIDGVLNPGEWAENTAMYADSLSQIKQISDWAGPDDLSGSCVIMWDEENMYLLGEVTDNIFSNSGTADRYWEGDGIQFGIIYDEVGDVRIGQAHTTFHELGIGLFPQGTAIYRTMSQDNVYPNGYVDGELEVKTTGTKTVYEMKIPWKNFLREGDQPKLGDTLGFSFLIDDNDGNGRRGWIEYASGIGESKNTQLFTYLTLIE